jgi:phospholipid/cholesterol/gamma-HCH transport system ATP-binding protein
MAERSDSQPFIRVEDVHKSFNGLPVLNGVRLDIYAGQTTVVIGPSGCGKTVLLKHVVGLLRPDRGRVVFDGVDITRYSERQLVPIRRRVGFLFQSGALFDSMTVAENIQFPLAESGMSDPDRLSARTAEVLRMVGLPGIEGKLPDELSGGQRKRVALARAVALRPEMLLYDEPTTGLDPIRADLINELILKLQSELKTTALVVTHDMASARKVADRIVMLYKGRLLLDTTPHELDTVTDETAARFIEGRATQRELNELRSHDHGSDHEG